MFCIKWSKFLSSVASPPFMAHHHHLSGSKICAFQHFLCGTPSTSRAVGAHHLHHLSGTAAGEQHRDSSGKTRLCALSAVPTDELGISILHPEANRTMQRIVLISKVCSLGSSSFGLVMIPLLTSSLCEPIAERPAVAVFAGVANAFLLLFAFTPLLLHLLTKRFVQNVFFNKSDQVFTTVHYNFFLQKRALRFTADQLDEAQHVPNILLMHGCKTSTLSESPPIFWIDASEVPKDKRFWLPLATCLVHSYPMLLSLDAHCYNDQTAFELLTKNIKLATKETQSDERTSIDGNGMDDDDRR